MSLLAGNTEPPEHKDRSAQPTIKSPTSPEAQMCTLQAAAPMTVPLAAGTGDAVPLEMQSHESEYWSCSSTGVSTGAHSHWSCSPTGVSTAAAVLALESVLKLTPTVAAVPLQPGALWTCRHPWPMVILQLLTLGSAHSGLSHCFTTDLPPWSGPSCSAQTSLHPQNWVPQAGRDLKVKEEAVLGTDGLAHWLVCYLYMTHL